MSWLDTFFRRQVEDAASVLYPQEPFIQFAGAGLTNVVDDPVNKRTIVTIGGGALATLNVWGGDLVNSGLSAQYVSSLSFSAAATGGTIAINGTSTVLQWAQNATPNYSQAQQSNTSAPVNMQFNPAAPGSSASNATNGTPASFAVNAAIPVNGGAEAGLVVQRAGVNEVQLGAFPGAPSNGAIWVGNITKSGANAAFIGDGVNQTILNAPVNIFFEISGSSPILAANANGFQFFNGAAFSLGGGAGVIGITNSTTLFTTVPSGGGVIGHDSIGLHYDGPSTSFCDYMLAPVQQGSVNSQSNKYRVYSGPARTTTNAAVTILTIPLATAATNAGIFCIAQGRDVSAGTVTDGVTIQTVFQFKNVSGTLTQGATTATPLKANDTSMAACTLTATVSGTNILIQVTGLTSVTIDWLAYAQALVN